MKCKIFLVTTIILFIGLGVAGYFIFDFSEQVEGLRVENENLISTINEKTEENENLELKLTRIEEFRLCDGLDRNIPSSSYTSIETISEYLQTWFKSRGTKKITEVSTNTIWAGDKTSMITFVSEDPTGDTYLDVFVVYFREDFYFNGVFVVFSGCWLDFEI